MNHPAYSGALSIAALSLFALACCAPAAHADARQALPASAGIYHITHAPVVYTPANLEQHIDGQSQAVQRYVFHTCTYGVYAPHGKGNQVLTADIYTMGSPLDAFGYYSTQLAPSAGRVKHIALGASGFAMGTSVTFWKGPYYVLVTNEAGASAKGAMLSLARLIAAHLQGSSAEPALLKMLPAGAKPYSQMYQRRDVAGQSFLVNGVTARYPAAGGEAALFVCRLTGAAAALRALESYANALNKPFTLAPGAHIVPIKGMGTHAFSVKTRFSGLVIAAVKGADIVGILRAANSVAAEKLVRAALVRAH